MIIPLALLTRNTLKRIYDSSQKRKRLVIFFVTLAIGAVVSAWIGFAFKYEVGNNLKIVGFPIPLVAFHLWEDGQWLDFPMPHPLLNAILNLAIVTLLTLAPLNIIFRLPREQMEQKKNCEPRRAR